MKATWILPLVLIASSTGQDDDAAAKPASGVPVRGAITFDGKRPEPKLLTVKDSQLKGCTHGGEVDLTDRSLLVSKTGGIANVVVTLDVEGAELVVPKEPVEMDNLSCRFEPHVAVVPEGGTVRFKNSDPTSHNIHTYSKKTSGVNKTVPAGKSVDVLLKRDETFKVTCDLHPWMMGWVVVTESPYVAVTDAEGAFEIRGVPPGEHKATLWHETLGKKSVTVVVTEKKGAVVDWAMKRPEKRRRK